MTMKNKDLLILAGVGLIVYYFYTKRKKVIAIDPPMETKGNDEKKTIVLDLNNTRSKNNANRLFSQSMVKDFNASKFATTSPPSVVVKQVYNDF
jgi:hypothetical protein